MIVSDVHWLQPKNDDSHFNTFHETVWAVRQSATVSRLHSKLMEVIVYRVQPLPALNQS